MLTIEKKRDSFWIYPFQTSYYSKKEQRVIGTCPKLDRTFADYDFVYKRYALKMKIYDKKDKILKLPLGVGINWITQTLEANGVYEYDITDNSEEYTTPRPIDFKIKDGYVPRDSTQEQSITFLMYKDMEHKKMLSLDTSLGKTFCTIYALSKMYVPSLIISSNLSDQWIDKIDEYTNCNIKNTAVYRIQGKNTILKLMKMKHDRVDHVFYVASTQTLIRYMEDGGNLQELADKLGIGVKVFDEVHMNFSANICIDTNMNTEKTFYLTATPERSSDVEKRRFKMMFQNVPTYGISTHLATKHYNIRLVNYNTHASSSEVDSCFLREGFSGIMYFNYLFRDFDNKIYLYGMIKMLFDQLHAENPKGKVLVYIPKLSYIHEIQQMFDSKGYKIGSYTSDVENKLKQFQLEKHLIFSTIGSASTGLDLKNLMAIFNFTPFRSHVIARQILGRLRPWKDGSEVYYYDFIDSSFEHMKKQRENRMIIFKPRSRSIKEKTISYDDVVKYLSK